MISRQTAPSAQATEIPFLSTEIMVPGSLPWLSFKTLALKILNTMLSIDALAIGHGLSPRILRLQFSALSLKLSRASSLVIFFA